MADQHFSAHGPLTKGRATHFSACGLGGEGGADQHFSAHGTETYLILLLYVHRNRRLIREWYRNRVGTSFIPPRGTGQSLAGSVRLEGGGGGGGHSGPVTRALPLHSPLLRPNVPVTLVVNNNKTESSSQQET